MKETIVAGILTAGSIAAAALGGWDLALRTLIYFMAIDYAMGLTLAGVFKRSKKNSGALNSHIGFKGVVKKGIMLLMVIIGYQLDYMIGWDFIRYAVIIAFIVNELISIIENASLMGVPVPHVLKQAIEILKKKGDEQDGK